MNQCTLQIKKKERKEKRRTTKKIEEKERKRLIRTKLGQQHTVKIHTDRDEKKRRKEKRVLTIPKHPGPTSTRKPKIPYWSSALARNRMQIRRRDPPQQHWPPSLGERQGEKQNDNRTTRDRRVRKRMESGQKEKN